MQLEVEAILKQMQSLSPSDIPYLLKYYELAVSGLTVDEIISDENQDALNQSQLNLFLCMHLENSGQSSSILSFFQEWFPEHTNKVVEALKDIDAINSSTIIQKAIKLLPEDGSWFYDKADEKTKILFEELDKRFSDYPDGSMTNLYRKYADKWKKEITSGIIE